MIATPMGQTPIGWVAGGVATGLSRRRLAERPPGQQQHGAEPEQAGDRADERDDADDLQDQEPGDGGQVRSLRPLGLVPRYEEPFADPDPGHQVAGEGGRRPDHEHDGQSRAARR